MCSCPCPVRTPTFQCCQLLYAACGERSGVGLQDLQLVLLLLHLLPQFIHLLLQRGMLSLQPVAGQLRYCQVLTVLSRLARARRDSSSGQARSCGATCSARQQPPAAAAGTLSCCCGIGQAAAVAEARCCC